MASPSNARSRSAVVLYPYLVSRIRLERRSNRVVRFLERRLPGRLGERPLFVFCLLKAAAFVVETAVLGTAVFGLLKLADPLLVLSLLFTLLLLAGAGTGLTTTQRTTIPFDQERLMTAPISDRRLYLLSFLGAGSLELLDNVVMLPLVVGVVASLFLTQAPDPMLWTAVALTLVFGLSSALVVDRFMGWLRVRRVERGARAASLAGFFVFSAIAFAVGAFAARAIVPWASGVPWRKVLSVEEFSNPDDSARLFSSIPGALSGAFDLGLVRHLELVFAHPTFPPATLARGALGDVTALASAAGMAVAVTLVAVIAWGGSGRWYRSGWRENWQNWTSADILDLLERLYLGAGRALRPADIVLKVQVHNLYRRREWLAASVADFFGGWAPWVWVGAAFGAAPWLQSSPGAALIFALVVGGATGRDYGMLSLWFRESLTLDAEGRQVGLYRAAGVGVFRLYSAKLLLGRMVALPPLATTLLIVILVAGLSPSASVVLISVGLSAWIVESQIKLMPSLISPHFDWDHPDDMADYVEQLWISGRFDKAAGLVSVVQMLVLVLLFTKGYLSVDTLPWLASALAIFTALLYESLFRSAGRRWTRRIDTGDLNI